jgi:hypothetical protein
MEGEEKSEEKRQKKNICNNLIDVEIDMFKIASY